MNLDELIAQIENSGEGQSSQTQTYATAKADEHLRGVLEQLEGLGELRPAEKLELERLRAGSAQAQDTIGSTSAAYRGALQGATFQQADEIYGLFGGDKDAARERNRAAEEAYPREYRRGKTGGAIATGLGTAVATAPYAAGATLLRTAGRGAVIGGAEGALWGSGGGETLDEKLEGAAQNGTLGASLGFAAPYAVKLSSSGAQTLGDVLGGVLNRGNQRRAERAVLGALRRSGGTLDGAADEMVLAARQGQPEFRLMDAMGVAGQRQASGIVRGGGDGAEEISAFLRQRQLDQRDRISGFIDEAFLPQGGSRATGSDLVPVGHKFQDAPEQVLSRRLPTAEIAKRELKAARSAVADTSFDAARNSASPVDVRDAVAVIDARIGGMRGSGIKGDGIDAKLDGFRGRLMARAPEKSQLGQTGVAPVGADMSPSSIELSDFNRVLGVKQDVQDAIGAAVRAGRNNEARELGKLVAELDAALEKSSAGYRAANDQFRKASRVMGAVDEGAQMASRGRGADNASQFSAMTAPQRDAARLGYGDALLARLERATAPTANHAKPLSSTKAQIEASAMSANPELLSARIARENQMWATQNRALGGSRTADNLQDISDTGAVTGLIRAGRDVASGNLGNAAANVLSMAGDAVGGRNAATREIIARLLMSRDTSALKVALQKELRAQQGHRISEGILRAIGRSQDILD